MFPGVNPRQVQQMMRKMGIQQQDIPAIEVIIKLEDKEIIIKNPSVARINMMGQQTFQISGEIHEQEHSKTVIAEEDIKTVMEQAHVSHEKAQAALEKTSGDLAEAIMNITGGEE